MNNRFKATTLAIAAFSLFSLTACGDEVKNTAEGAKDTIGKTASESAQKAGETAQKAGETAQKAGETAMKAADSAKDAAGNAANKAKGAMGRMQRLWEGVERKRDARILVSLNKKYLDHSRSSDPVSRASRVENLL